MVVKSLVAAFLVASASWAQQPELHRGTEYPGAAAFPELGDITIVYPAGQGEPVDRNRRSAEARGK